MTIKIADFGFAAKATGNSLTQQCGSPQYVAPEIIMNKAHGKPVDMWSIGVICFILLGGYPPFHHDSPKELFRLIKTGSYEFTPKYWDIVSEEAKDLIRNLLVVNPQERLTVKQALNHKWLLDCHEKLSSRCLKSNLKTLRRFNARMKFRMGVKAIMAANRVTTMLVNLRKIKPRTPMKPHIELGSAMQSPNKDNSSRLCDDLTGISSSPQSVQELC